MSIDGKYSELEVRSKFKGQSLNAKGQSSKVKMAAEIGEISKWSKFKKSSFDLVKNLIPRNIKMRHFSLKPIF